MTSRRFLHLERERSAPGAQPEPQDAAQTQRPHVRERFGQSAPPSKPESDELPTGVSTARFQDDQSSGLGLDRGDADEHAFNRCVLCKSDNGRFVEFCGQCGSPLNTPEQRAFHAQLAEAHQRAQATDEAQLETLRAAQEEALTRHAELSRQATTLVFGQPETGTADVSLGRRLLQKVQNPRRRMAALLGCVALLLLPWFIDVGFYPRLLSLITFAVLFSPRGLRPRRRRSMFDVWSG